MSRVQVETAADESARLRKLVEAIEDVADFGHHPESCSDYWDNKGQCTCWISDIRRVLRGEG